MTCCWGVVSRLQDFSLQFFVVRDIDGVAIEEKTVDHVVVFNLLLEDSRGVLRAIAEVCEYGFERVVLIQGCTDAICEGVVIEDFDSADGECKMVSLEE